MQAFPFACHRLSAPIPWNRPSSSKEIKAPLSGAEKRLRQKKFVGRDVGQELGPEVFLRSFFLAPRIGALFIFSGVGTSYDVRCRVLSADGDACIHRCRQHCAA